MAKRKVTLTAGAAAVCLLFGAWYILKQANEQNQIREMEEQEGDIIVDAGEMELASITFEIAGEPVTFLSEGEEWTLEGDASFPVNSSRLQSLLSYLEPLTAVRTLENIEDSSEFGMDTPANTFSLTETDRKETILTIGNNNEGTGDDYLMRNEETEVIYTVSASLRTSVSDDLYDYAVSEEIPSFSADDIVKVQVTGEEGTYELQKEEEEWAVSGTEGEPEQEEVENAVSGLEYLSYTDYVDHYCQEEETYGFETGQKITIVYEDSSAVEAEEETETEGESEGETEGETEEESEEETEGESEGETEEESEQETEKESEEETEAGKQCTLTFRIGDQDPEGNYYVQQENSAEVHTLSANILEPFLNREILS